MTRLTVDSDLRAKLANFEELVEICDESGRVVGFFHPVPASGKSASQAGSPITDEEIEACRKQQTGRPLTDILNDLDCPG